MNVLPRAASCCRPLFSASQIILRPSVAPLSIKATPRTTPYNPNANLKIPPAERPLSREPTPPPTKTPEELEALAYVVRRTPSVQLPVYRRWMSGGNRQVVLIKKVDGDRRKMLSELTADLGVGKDDVRINPITQHVEIKVRYDWALPAHQQCTCRVLTIQGDYFNEARNWLLVRGF